MCPNKLISVYPTWHFDGLTVRFAFSSVCNVSFIWFICSLHVSLKISYKFKMSKNFVHCSLKFNVGAAVDRPKGK